MKNTLETQIIKRIEDIGQAKEAIKRVKENELFNNLSKCSNYWHSEHEKEADKLWDIRCQLCSLYNHIDGVEEILNGEQLESFE